MAKRIAYLIISQTPLPSCGTVILANRPQPEIVSASWNELARDGEFNQITKGKDSDRFSKTEQVIDIDEQHNRSFRKLDGLDRLVLFYTTDFDKSIYCGNCGRSHNNQNGPCNHCGL